MYLDMPLANEPTVDCDADSSHCRSVVSLESSSDTQEERERLVALLQCAYSWNRVQALRQVARWAAMEEGGSFQS